MKLILKIIFAVLTIPVIVLCVFSLNIRDQYLSSRFWISTFRSNNVYEKVSNAMSSRLFTNVIAGGGKVSDITDLSGLISASTVESLFEKNVDNFIKYSNGKTKELMVYAPTSLGNDLTEINLKDLDSFSKEVTVQDFFDEYSITGINKDDLTFVSRLGLWSWLFTVFIYALLIALLMGMYFLTVSGKRLIAPAISFVVAGVIILGMFVMGKFLANLLITKYISSPNIGAELAAIIVPPIVVSTVRIWFWFGISALLSGAVLFFVRKSAKNKLD